MNKIRKGDIVCVIKGKDNGKKGKILSILPQSKSALVEGINLVKKHMRQRRQEQQAGILSIEAPLNLSNLSFFCKHCNRPVRVGFTLLKDGTKTRICRRCKEAV